MAVQALRDYRLIDRCCRAGYSSNFHNFFQRPQEFRQDAKSTGSARRKGERRGFCIRDVDGIRRTRDSLSRSDEMSEFKRDSMLREFSSALLTSGRSAF